MKLNDVTQTLTELNTDDSIITDYPIRMCGNEFLKNLKYVCSIRGIYTPINRFKRSFKQYYREKNNGDINELFGYIRLFTFY
ncbi:unnamed protein product [Schistosoma rodhaini]|nr:unnamed protein product [Schistosoma rodhaini]